MGFFRGLLGGYPPVYAFLEWQSGEPRRYLRHLARVHELGVLNRVHVVDISIYHSSDLEGEAQERDARLAVAGGCFNPFFCGRQCLDRWFAIGAQLCLDAIDGGRPEGRWTPVDNVGAFEAKVIVDILTIEHPDDGRLWPGLRQV